MHFGGKLLPLVLRCGGMDDLIFVRAIVAFMAQVRLVCDGCQSGSASLWPRYVHDNSYGRLFGTYHRTLRDMCQTVA